MSVEFAINGRKIGMDHPPLVIAEIGINHEGSLATAKLMVDAAARAGAEVVKHQSHVIEDEMSEVAKSVIPGNSKESIYEIMARCALSFEEELELKKYAEDKGLIFISTPFSRAAALNLEKMGVCAYKIGSGECNNLPLIELIASFGKPVILSTGMNSVETVRNSVEILEKNKIPYALLHCTNVYPTPHHLVRLGAMTELQKQFPNAIIGLSDHCVDNFACLGAVALGASILERHFTDTKERPGPDIPCSMDEGELRELIRGSNALFLARGGKKEPLPEEKVTMDFAFATVVTTTKISAGEEFSDQNIWVKRPGTGEIPAKEFSQLIGKTASQDLPKGKHLLRADVVNWV